MGSMAVETFVYDNSTPKDWQIAFNRIPKEFKNFIPIWSRYDYNK